MDKIIKLLLAHFEKGLLVLFGLGLFASVIWYGPFGNSVNFERDLQDLPRKMDARPQIEAAPQFESMYESFKRADAFPAEAPMAVSYVWPVQEKQTEVPVYPPMDVRTDAQRGYVALSFGMDPRQRDTMGALNFLGVEVQRAAVTSEGTGEFVCITKDGDRSFWAPSMIYSVILQKAPAILDNRPAAGGSTARRTPTVDRYTRSDFLNALHDGRATEQEILSHVQSGVRRGVYPSDMLEGTRETFQELRMGGPEMARELRETLGRAPTREEVASRILEDMGFPGGGRFKAAGPTPGADITAAANPDQPAVVINVSIEEISSFLDVTASPENEYAYRMRFIAEDVTETVRKAKVSDWSGVTPAVSPRPDTEFFLTGASQGLPMVLVRKWMPASNSWVVWTGTVAPGERIGHMETAPKKDSAGVIIKDDKGGVQMETIDFSTDSVLLEFRTRPRPFYVDTKQIVLYDTPQIIYSDLRGNLRMKWQTQANVR